LLIQVILYQRYILRLLGNLLTNLTIDTESTIYEKGHPFSRRNALCAISFKQDSSPSCCLPWEHSGPVSADTITTVQNAIDGTDLLIFFNAKHDLHWLRREGILKDYRLKQRIWDCQAAQFIIRNQQEKYPSLNSACDYFGLGTKLDIIEKEYWSKGIDTPNIPWPLLSEYACRDTDLTYALYVAQLKYLADKPELLQLCRLVCMDTLVLAEMEFNGLIYDREESIRRAEELDQEIKTIESELRNIFNIAGLNFSSPNHLSAILYGGVVKYTESIPYEHTFKSGKQTGLTVTRYKHKDIEITMPRLVDPVPKTKLKKEGLWSTDDGVLKRLHAKGTAKRVIELIKRRNELERLASTYYRGFPKIMDEKDWAPNEIHGQFNQTTVVTGRLSSNAPNLQNVPSETNELICTRYQ
jgi:DNA polymerase I